MIFLKPDEYFQNINGIFGDVEGRLQKILPNAKFENFVSFRDRLNADINLVEQYNRLKISGAGLSVIEYRAKKSRFIEAVLAKSIW